MITFVRGRSGRGKTHYILEKITELSSQNTNEKIFLVVPDQMSFQTEYQLLSMQKDNTMFGVEIVGLSRFVSQLITELFPVTYQQFDTLAQQMLLQHSAVIAESELNFYDKSIYHRDFIEYLHQFYRQMRGSLENISSIANTIESNQNPILSQKLQEIEKIFLVYETMLNKTHMDNADRMLFLQELLEQKEHQEKLQKMHVFIDGYHMFNKQEFELVSTVFKYAKSSTITFTIGEQKVESDSIFSVIQTQYNMFKRDYPHAMEVYCDNDYRYVNNETLNLIEKLYETPQDIEMNDERVTVDAYFSRQEEVEYIARQIRTLLENGAKAQEIGVYVPSRELYADDIQTIFERYHLPYYLDLKASMLYHPFMQWFLLLTKIVQADWRYEDVLALSSNAFFKYKYQIEEQDYYHFLRQVDRIQLTYPSIWKTEKYWYYYDNPSDVSRDRENMTKQMNLDLTTKVQNIRQALLTEIEDFTRICVGTTNNDVLQQLFEYLELQPVVDFFTFLEGEKPSYTSHLTEEQYHAMVWEKIVEVFEQAQLSIGQLEVSGNELLTSLQFGIETAEFTSVPLGFDCIQIGDFERSRFQTLHQGTADLTMGIKHTFILGLVEGTMPHMDDTSSLLTETDMLVLQDNELFTDLLLEKKSILYQLFRFYSLVTSSAESLHLSYYLYSGMQLDVEEQPASVLDMYGQQGFAINHRLFIDDSQKDIYKYALPLSEVKRQFAHTYKKHLQEQSIFTQYLAEQDQVLLRQLDENTSYQNDVEMTQTVETPTRISMSQLETYNLCPYKYFLRYVLHVKEPFKYELSPLQSGVLIHEGIEEVFDTVANQRIDVHPLSYYQDKIKTYFLDKKNELAKHPLLVTHTNQFLFDKMQETLEESFDFMYESEQASSFIPTTFEQEFREKIIINGEELEIRGKVDRIDETPEKDAFRIIDYKSSKRALDFDNLYHGTQLQLPFYSYLASKHLKQTLAGTMYVPVVDKIIAKNETYNEGSQYKEHQATGVFLDNKKLLEAFDQHLIDESKSKFITYDYKKDGTPGVHATVMTKAELERIHAYTVQKTRQTLTKIKANQFAVTPERKERDTKKIACSNCPFRSICQFDQKINHFSESDKITTGVNFKKKKETFFEVLDKGKED